MFKNRVVLLVVMILVLFTFNLQVLAREAPFSIEADDLILDKSGELVIARGRVRVEFEDLLLLADELEIDLIKEEILALGNVSYIEEELELTGSKMLYNYGLAQGEFIKAGGNVGELGVDSERIEMLSEDDFKLERATITSCIEEDPHHKFVARQATIYPGEMMVARNVEFWLGAYHLLTYPSYRVLLDDGTVLTPMPSFGYSNQEGFYVRVDYNHYLNPDLMGEISYRWNSRARDRLMLDYQYQLNEEIKLNPSFMYRPEKDEEQDENEGTKERELETRDWYGRLIFAGDFEQGVDLDFDLKYISERELIGDLQLLQTKNNFYWGLDYDYNNNWNYQPRLFLGTSEQELGNTGLLAQAEYNSSQLQFPKSEQEVEQRELELGLKYDDYLLSPTTKVTPRADFSRAWYEEHNDFYEHQLYKLGFDLKQDLSTVSDIHFSFEHIGESGETPAQFKDFGDLKQSQSEQSKWRRYYDLRLPGSSIEVGSSGIFDWRLRASRASYATNDLYHNYGYQLGYNQKLGTRTKLNLNYEYLTDSGQTPIRADQIDKKDHLNAGLSYDSSPLSLGASLEYHLAQSEYTTAKAELGYRTNGGEWPHWSLRARAEYDFKDEEYEEQLVELKRVYDCMELLTNWDFAKQSGELRLELKY